MTGIDIYGTPGPILLERLRRKAHMLGGDGVVVHELQEGFDRFPTPGA